MEFELDLYRRAGVHAAEVKESGGKGLKTQEYFPGDSTQERTLETNSWLLYIVTE